MPSKNSSCRRALFQLLFTEGLKLYAPLEKKNQHRNSICYIDIAIKVAISDWVALDFFFPLRIGARATGPAILMVWTISMPCPGRPAGRGRAGTRR